MVKSRGEKQRQESRKASARQWAEQKDVRFEPTAVKLPDGVERIKFDKAGVVKWDFMLFRAGKNNPSASEGFEAFNRTYECHPRVPTPDGPRAFACRKKCFGDKCAICEFMVENGRMLDDELKRGIKLQLRHLWLVNDNPGSKKIQWKVLDSNHFNRGLGFGELMKEAILSLEEGVEPFALKGGYTAVMRVKEQSPFTKGGAAWYTPTRIDLQPHSYSYPNSLLDEAPCLDDCIIDPGYKEVKKLLESGLVGDSEEKEDEEESPNRNGKASAKKKPSRDDEEEDEDETEEPDDDEDIDEDPDEDDKSEFSIGDKVEHEDYGECKVMDVSSDGSSLTLKDAKGKTRKGIDPGEVVKLDEEDEEEEELDEDEELDDSDEEEDEDEKPPAKKGRGRGKK